MRGLWERAQWLVLRAALAVEAGARRDSENSLCRLQRQRAGVASQHQQARERVGGGQGHRAARARERWQGVEVEER